MRNDFYIPRGIVFSRTLKKASWSNTRLVKEGLEAEVKQFKKSSKRDLVVMGSGTIVSQLAQAGLIDQYQLVRTLLTLRSSPAIVYHLPA